MYLYIYIYIHIPIYNLIHYPPHTHTRYSHANRRGCHPQGGYGASLLRRGSTRSYERPPAAPGREARVPGHRHHGNRRILRSRGRYRGC